MTRILLVDDHEVVRLGLKTLLERHPGFEVCGEAGSAREGLELALKLQPDLVVLDIRMPDGSGIEVCREIRSSQGETKVIMLTSYADDEAVFASILAGADGYFLKQIGSKQLIEAVETVSRGQSLLDPQVTKKVFDKMKANILEQENNLESSLNEQERKILLLIGQGLTNKQIAQQIFLSEKTVRNYVSNILSKMGFSNRAQAAAYAAKKGI